MRVASAHVTIGIQLSAQARGGLVPWARAARGPRARSLRKILTTATVETRSNGHAVIWRNANALCTHSRPMNSYCCRITGVPYGASRKHRRRCGTEREFHRSREHQALL